MGCDIHLVVEKRGENGEWVRAESMGQPWWVKDGSQLEEPVRQEWYRGRNYALFAMLAGVRNYPGLDYKSNKQLLTPIAEPRGLPADVTEETKKYSDEWGIDGHSHSWLTLEELLAVDWDSPVKHTCWARKKRNALPHRTGEDDDTFAKKLEVSATFMGRLPPAENWEYETCGWSSEGQGKSGWRTIEWTEPWAQAAGNEWLALMLRMARNAPGKQKWIRVVFWFDN